MKELWGLREISRFMGWADPRTPIRALKREGFLMIRRRRGKHPRPVWYSNSDLIRAWMIAKAKADREMLLKREQAKGGRNEAS